MHTSALKRAIEILGGQTALARVCGVQQGQVWNWLHRNRKTPPQYVLPIERATHGAVTRYELRHDIFGPAPGVDPEPPTASPSHERYSTEQCKPETVA